MNVGMPLTIEKGSFLRFLRPRSSPRRGGGGRNDDDDDYDDRGGGWGGGGGGKSVAFHQGSARGGMGLPTKGEFLARGGGLSGAPGWPQRDPREDAHKDPFYLDSFHDPYAWKDPPGGSSVRLRPGSKEDADERATRRAKEHRRRSPSPGPVSDESDDRRRPPPSRKKTPSARRIESSDDEDVRRPPKGGSRSGGARSRKAESSDDGDPPPKKSSTRSADGEALHGGSANSTLPCYPHMFDKDGYALGIVEGE